MKKLALWIVTLTVALMLAQASALARPRTVKLKAKSTNAAMAGFVAIATMGISALFATTTKTVRAKTDATRRHTVAVDTSQGERFFVTPRQDKKLTQMKLEGSFSLKRVKGAPAVSPAVARNDAMVAAARAAEKAAGLPSNQRK